MSIVIWSSLFLRFQKLRIFTVDSFLQMVKNVPVNSLLVMHSLNELVVKTLSQLSKKTFSINLWFE
jgi:hypothetical protein